MIPCFLALGSINYSLLRWTVIEPVVLRYAPPG
jgi:hypothetical protein